MISGLGAPRKVFGSKYRMNHSKPARFLDFAVQAGRFLSAALCRDENTSVRQGERNKRRKVKFANKRKMKYRA